MPQKPNCILSLEGLLIFTLEQENRFLEAGVLGQAMGHELQIVVSRKFLNPPNPSGFEPILTAKLSQKFIREYEEAFIYIDGGAGIPSVVNNVTVAETSQSIDNTIWNPFTDIPNLEGSDFAGNATAISRNIVRPSIKVTSGKFFSTLPNPNSNKFVYVVNREALEKLKHDNVITGHPNQGELDALLKEKLGGNIKAIDRIGTAAVTQLTLEQGQALVFCLGRGSQEIFRLPFEPNTEFKVELKYFPIEPPLAHGTTNHANHPPQHLFHSLLFYEALTDFTPAAQQKVLTNLALLFAYFGLKDPSEGGTGDPICPSLRRGTSRVAATL